MSTWATRGLLVRAALLMAAAPLILTTATASVAAAAVTTGVGHRQPTQRLAVLLTAHEAYAQPNGNSHPLALVQASRPLTGEETVLPVLRATTAHGTHWLRAMLPGRPDGRTGWISAQDTFAVTTGYEITVDTATRTVTVYQYGRSVMSAPAVVGKASTPTPLGSFFVEEVLDLASNAVGAPYAFALSARSNVLQEFDGGPGQIALHGLENVGGVLGTAASHGCVRLSNATLAWMVTRIGPGVPVTIKR